MIDHFDIDLDLDQKSEKVQLKKKNGLDYLSIMSANKDLLFEQEIVPMGKNSFIKKVTHLKVNSLEQCLLLHYDQGQTGIKSFKRSIRLLSFCYHTANLKKISVQDLGYVFWDLQAVASYMQQKAEVTIENHSIRGEATAVLILRHMDFVRTWTFNNKEFSWKKLPEKMYAEYGVRLIR